MKKNNRSFIPVAEHGQRRKEAIFSPEIQIDYILNPRMQKAELPSTGSAARATLSESVGENLE